jgi:hypothetical protein
MKNIKKYALLGAVLTMVAPMIAVGLKLPGKSTTAKEAIEKEFSSITYSAVAKSGEKYWGILLKFREGLALGKGQTRWMSQNISSSGKSTGSPLQGDIKFTSVKKVGKKSLLKARPVMFDVRLERGSHAIEFTIGTAALKLLKSGKPMHLTASDNDLKGEGSYKGVSTIVLQKSSNSAQEPSTTELKKLAKEVDEPVSEEEDEAKREDKKNEDEDDD